MLSEADRNKIVEAFNQISQTEAGKNATIIVMDGDKTVHMPIDWKKMAQEPAFYRAIEPAISRGVVTVDDVIKSLTP